ncbi:MAG: flagellar hook protein FlgE [Desulfovibrio sp.]|jgi:flagellar hook protein FlgE|nr:flagellar hook protein FlgE [Desulfovibrio sp.]
MNSALYIGATGMKGLSEGMAVTTNNIANVSTIAFKCQDIQYSDLIYTTQAQMGDWWLNQEGSRVAVGQVGKGLQVDSVRTIFQQGGMESSNTLTDLAISGKGFFQVTDGVNLYYTRAGDFRMDNQGVLRNPEGLALNGWKVNDSGNADKSILYPVQIDRFSTMPAKASSNMSMVLNLGLDADRTSDAGGNPYFSLLSAYDASANPPLSDSAVGFSQSLTLYDAQGNARQATVYFDKVSGQEPNSVVEFVIASDVARSGDGTSPSEGAGLLMSGTLTFSSSGQLTDMSAFTPTVAGDKNLQNWQPANLSDDGSPQFSLDGTPVSVGFGLKAGGGWEHAPASADAVTGLNSLPSMGSSATRAQNASTAYGASPQFYMAEQNGYSEGQLSYYNIGTDGMVTGYYSNGQGKDLWQIPLCRFTSEDGLRRQGNNLFAATAESGQMEMGAPGTENYGTVQAYNTELSNVDMATEMVNMIITQRGFQSNSKVVTTADQMLQKAIELKRS